VAKGTRPQSRASAAELSNIVAKWLLDDLTPRQRVAHALAFGRRLDREKLIADELRRKYRRSYLMVLAAETGRLKGGRPRAGCGRSACPGPRKEYRPDEMQFVCDVMDARFEAAAKEEHLTYRKACFRLSGLPKYRKRYSGIAGEAL
jgi:hypothetical protein